MPMNTTTGEVVEGIDLLGQLAFVTGASGGLGPETARALAAAGATVALAARDPAKTEAALQTIREGVPRARLQSLTLDLASLASVRRSAGEFLAAHARLQLLINNAGLVATPSAVQPPVSNSSSGRSISATFCSPACWHRPCSGLRRRALITQPQATT